MLNRNVRRHGIAGLAMSAAAVLLLTGCASGETTSSSGGGTVPDDIDAVAAKWADGEFALSALTRDEKIAEMKWFAEAASALGVSEISVVSETIDPHVYESETLTQAFKELTGISVTHDLIGEGDVIERIQTEIKTRTSIYDGYINDSDLIGTHQRGDYIYPVGELMKDSAITTLVWTSKTTLAQASPLVLMAFSTSYLTSSSRTFTGSVTTGSATLTSRSSSRTFTVMT